MRTIATQSDVYGPSAGLDMRQTTLASVPAAGGGNATQTGQAQVPQTALFPALANTIFGKPITALFVFIGLLVAYKLIEEKRGTADAFQEMKLGLNNVVKVTLIVIVGFALIKYLSARYSVPGISSFLQYATGGNLG